MYDPYTARFLSPDPELQDPSDTQSYNRYSYVLNNPFKYVDPTGFRPGCVTGGGSTTCYGGIDDYLSRSESGFARDYFQNTAQYNTQPAHPYLTMNMADIRQQETAAVIDVVAGRFETVLTFAPTPVAVELWAAKIIATLPLALKLKAVAKGAGLADDAARAVPMGAGRSPMKVPGPQNVPTNIGGRQYTGHALDQMQGRGITPSVVEDTLAHGVKTSGRDGATIFTTDQARVIVNPNGSIKTVYGQ